MSTPDDSLQALLANLRPRTQAPASHTNSTQAIAPEGSTGLPTSPSLASPTFSNGSALPKPQAQNLLNLLNFGNTASQPAPLPRSISASIPHPSLHRGSASQEGGFTAADLLRQAAVANPSNRSPSASGNAASAEPTPAPLAPAFTPAPNEVSQTAVPSSSQGAPKSIFTYKNPFEALRASRPHTPRTQQQMQLTVENPGQQTPPKDPKEPTQPELQPEEVSEPVLRETAREQDIPLQSIEDPAHQEIINDGLPERVKLMPKSQSSRQNTPIQPTNLARDIQAEVNGSAKAEESKIAAPTSQRVNSSVIVEDSTNDTGDGQPYVRHTGERVVPVLTFPVRAFVSITLHLDAPASARVREDGVMEISRLKKDFDQMDRSLAAASSKYIIYALVKNGGMRIIRQDNGKDRHIFKHTNDRIFNVSLCTSSLAVPTTDHQAVLGTGVSGAVYYATICKPELDYFESNDLSRECLIFPAFPHADENTAGGVLKTRAKRSSRHPEFFAIGRGKAIHIVWPASVMNASYGITEDQRTVDVEKLFQERPLQILTGKAGKDFIFSEDDTMIVSLDKTGRLRFWDIRKLIDAENARSVQITPYIIDTPVLTLATASPAEKSWPASVLFVDKARPYTRGGALRYVLVGLRQNHTLQLWDIALGKAVQEINFPHDSETDGICSVTYHPASGIIAVGHPTRNSIFFIHLSAPRYVLSSSLTQASFVQRVAAKDPDIPKPESTACMSGIRELSFEGRGQLRSLELLPVHKQGEDAQPENSDALFELYVAHSTGVTCLMINNQDLGWTSESKVIESVNAEEKGMVTLKDLKLGSVVENDTRSKSPSIQELPSTTKTEKKKKQKKSKETAEEGTNGVPELPQSEVGKSSELTIPESITMDSAAVEQPSTKESKKSKKKKDPGVDPTKQEPASRPEPTLPVSESLPRQVASPNPQEPSSLAEQLSMSISGDWLDKEMKKLEKGVNAEFKKELEQLYQNIQTDRTSQDQASASRQEAVLRVVSSTLNTNVEKSLTHILQTQMQEVVVPSVVQAVSTDISKQLTQSITQTVKKEIGSELPAQIDRTLQSPHMLVRVAENVSTRINGLIEQEITKAITGTVATSMKAIATSTALEVIAVSEARMAEQVAQMSRQHAAFNDKIEQLNGALAAVTSTLQSMMQTQANFQSQVLQDLQEAQTQKVSHPSSLPPERPVSAVLSPTPSVKAVPARQPAQSELEIEEISNLMQTGNYEEASIKWLQSSQQVKLFDELFVRYTPDYLATDVSPLVAFSVGITIANSLSTNTLRRLEWVAASLQSIDFKDHEILELKTHAQSLVGTMTQKLEALYTQRQAADPSDVVLRMIPPLLGQAGHLLDTFQAIGSS